MDQNLRGLFAEALDDEPALPAGSLAEAAMTDGARLRRKRRLFAGATAAAVAATVVVALNVIAPGPDPAAQVEAGAALRVPVKPGCSTPADRRATDVSIFLTDDITTGQRDDLRAVLAHDPRVREFRFEDRKEAYQKFVELWKDSPDFVKSVGPAALPESFRVALAQQNAFPAVATMLQKQPGVQDVVGNLCSWEGE
ncbi:permease-like cell division protein FtsX [Actinoplanes friuliensis]|uniref:FtsX extracellular domain-containing protein n=1 Tax=Actinoplanes friuliensis DSM 7358 TaxID=1246995 RepID=U5VZF5_9ACTN|nr:permease-like cell division protein FtsX [Actinoplanes friuliensis]AGZ42269.1 hypothetical protein AFR_19985 [Actinoplanes friuliensis DSM 7358]